MASLGKQARRAIDAVWSNQTGHRYVPRAYSSAGPGWGVWDKRDKRWVEEDAELAAIDPSETLTTH